MGVLTEVLQLLNEIGSAPMTDALACRVDVRSAPEMATFRGPLSRLGAVDARGALRSFIRETKAVRRAMMSGEIPGEHPPRMMGLTDYSDLTREMLDLEN